MSVHPWPPPAASSESLQWWIVCGNAGPQGTSAVLLGQFNRTAATQEQWAKRSALPAPALPGTEVSRAKEQSVAPRHSYHFHLEVRSQTQFSTGKEAWGMRTYKGSADRLITTWQHHQVPISPTVHGSVLDQLSPAGATESWRSRADFVRFVREQSQPDQVWDLLLVTSKGHQQCSLLVCRQPVTLTYHF